MPIVDWQACFYVNIFALRLFLYIYCVSLKLAKCAITTLLGFLMPLLTAMTVAGSYMYNKIRLNEPDCYPDAWSIIFSLAIGWFLVYIYFLLGCTALYNKLYNQTRLGYCFRIFTHLHRHDPVIISMTPEIDEDAYNALE